MKSPRTQGHTAGLGAPATPTPTPKSRLPQRPALTTQLRSGGLRPGLERCFPVENWERRSRRGGKDGGEEAPASVRESERAGEGQREPGPPVAKRSGRRENGEGRETTEARARGSASPPGGKTAESPAVLPAPHRPQGSGRPTHLAFARPLGLDSFLD